MAVETFTETQALINEVADRITTQTKGLAQARVLLNRAVSDLTAVATDYSGASAEIDALAAANPGDANWENAKDKKDKLLADRATALAKAQALLTAYDSV